MTHAYELKIIDFMKRVAKEVTPIDELLLKPAAKDVDYYLRKIYEEDPNRPFTIRLSNIGKPLCQLQMEQRKAPAVEDDWNLPLRFMYGGIIEGLTVSILRNAGINIEEEQTAVVLELEDGNKIKGTLDLVIDGRVWDIKSASSHSYKEKFASYESLKESDSFGYLPQLYGYSKARGLPPGGWIVVDKSSGETKIIEVSSQWEEDQKAALRLIAENVKILSSDNTFKKCFTDKNETFKKRLTGNKVLDYPCTFCGFKYSCWDNLQYLAAFESKAYDKPFKYYTQIGHQETNVHSLAKTEG